jgi:hypothetical protein
LDTVAVLNVRRSINAPAVDERSVAAVQVREDEAVGVGRVTADPGVVTAYQILPIDVESDLGGRLSPDQHLAETLKGNFFHLIGLRPIQVTNNDVWHKASFCQVERIAHLSPLIRAIEQRCCAIFLFLIFDVEFFAQPLSGLRYEM